MAAYNLNLKPASFRDVSFGVLEADLSGGRRTVTHEYPGRDEPYTEDLGRKARTFSVKAYVIGEDFKKKRDNLLTAIETEGPGTLVHPWFGTKNVQVTTYSVHDSWQNGGYSEITIEFAESKDTAFPVVEVSAVESVVSAADSAETTAASAFSGVIDVTDTTVSVSTLTAISKMIETLEDDMQSEIAKKTAKLSEFTKGITDISTDTAALIKTPLTLANKLITLAKTLSTASSDVVSAIGAYKRFFANVRGNLEEIAENFSSETSLGAAVLKNISITEKLASVAAVSSSARCAVSVSYGRQTNSDVDASGTGESDSYSERAEKIIPALDVATGADEGNTNLRPGQTYITREDITAAKETVLDMIDTLADSLSENIDSDDPNNPEYTARRTWDDSIYESIMQIRSELITAPMPDIAQLKNLKSIELADPLPSLVLSYNLYGSLNYADDIVNRNGLVNPAEIPNGRTLEVISNE